jgi:hypothetical protein
VFFLLLAADKKAQNGAAMPSLWLFLFCQGFSLNFFNVEHVDQKLPLQRSA